MMMCCSRFQEGRGHAQTLNHPEEHTAAATTAKECEVKSCNLCGEIKTFEEFPVRHRGGSVKMDAYCKQCTRLITPARQRGMKISEMRKTLQVQFKALMFSFCRSVFVHGPLLLQCVLWYFMA